MELGLQIARHLQEAERLVSGHDASSFGRTSGVHTRPPVVASQTANLEPDIDKVGNAGNVHRLALAQRRVV